MADFTGFPKTFFTFFRELKANNERAWFEANKTRYRETVQAPMSDFIAAMAQSLRSVSKEFVADPRPNGGSMFRIHRDVRFAHDKRPYKEHTACQFRHRLGRDVHAPGFYVHLAPGEVFFGAGLWMPDAPALLRVRTRIASKPLLWKKVVTNKKFLAAFEGLEGDSLVRPPQGFDPAHPFIADLKRKSFVATSMSSERHANSPRFVEDASQAFAAAAQLMRFLADSLEIPF
jgi:uncharacterized protein (TIGR02453 family)